MDHDGNVRAEKQYAAAERLVGMGRQARAVEMAMVAEGEPYNMDSVGNNLLSGSRE